MSFGKAKIKRFNDVKACAPSPATYLVELKNKPKGAALQQSERFPEKSVSNYDAASTQSVPCFRTPVLLKKKVKPAVNIAPTVRQSLKPKRLNNECSEKEALREKIVECENKDAYIKDLTQQLEEINERMCELKKQKDALDIDKAEYGKTVDNLKVEHEADLKNLKVELNKKLSQINDKKTEVTLEIVSLKNELKVFKDVHLKNILEVKANCDKFPTLFQKAVNEYAQVLKDKELQLENKEIELNSLEKNCIEIQNNHSSEMERLKKEHQIEIQDMEFEMLKLMHEIQSEKDIAAHRIGEIEQKMRSKIAEMTIKFENEKQQIMLESKQEMEQVQMKLEQSNTTSEAELHQKLEEVEKKWRFELEKQQKESAAILKECQAISEYSIIQCEVEKNKLLSNLKHTSEELQSVHQKYAQLDSSFEDLTKRYFDLENQLAEASTEISKTKEELQTELDDKNRQINKMKKENTTCEITVKHTQKTIEVLTRRLIHSDQDVEQLKKELSDCEAKILDYEQKCSQISADLKLSQAYSEELDLQYESSLLINRTEIDEMGQKLLKRVDDYEKEVAEYSKKLDAEKKIKNEVIQQLHDAFDMINRLKIELDNVEILHTQYKFEVEQSQNELEDYHMREMDWNIVRDKLEHTIKELEELLEIRQDEISSLKKKCYQLEESNQSYHQYSEYYQQKVKEYESELVETGNINKKYIEMSGKYDELAQKFEELDFENSQNKNKFSQLMIDSEKMAEWKEKYHRREEEYNRLLNKYESLVEQNKFVDNSVELENNKLLSRVQYLENDLKEATQKFAEVAGHQNNKQKIKHLVDLKAKNEELLQNNVDLDMKLKSHQKLIEKLRKENSDLKKYMKKSKVAIEDKENFGSPNRSLNSSRIESPFRERN